MSIPLPPRPNLEQYKKLARDFQDACKSSDPTAFRQEAARWVETLVRLQDRERGLKPDERDREVERLEQHWHKITLTAGNAANCTLACAQLFIAREHGFKSWPK